MNRIGTPRPQPSELQKTVSFFDPTDEERSNINPEHNETAEVPPEDPQVFEPSVFDNLSKTPTGDSALVSDDDEKREETLPDKFDSLSGKLAIQAEKLDEAAAEQEKVLRDKVVESLKNFKAGESDLGKSLYEYRAVYKEKRQWTSVAKKIADTMNCSSRTLYRMIDEYESKLTQGLERTDDIDRNAIDGPTLSKQERRELRARLSIRVLLNNTQENSRLEVLANLLAEEAYQVWGDRESFEIKVEPRPSKFTIDGRIQNAELPVEEKAA